MAYREAWEVAGLGVLEEEQGHYEQALTYYLFSSAMDSTFTPGYYNAAMMYENLGQPDIQRLVKPDLSALDKPWSPEP